MAGNTKFASDGNYPAGSDDWSGQPRQVALTISEAKQGFTPNEPVPAEVLNYLFAACFPDVQTFTANGTWTKPENAQLVHVKEIGKGGDGGGGGTQGGGGGGSSGEMREFILPASEMPATATATITGLNDPLTGNPGMVRLSGTGIQLDARPGYDAGFGTGSVGGDGGSNAPDLQDGSAGAGGNGAVGGTGKGFPYDRKFSGGGGGGDTNFAGGAGGAGDCNVGRGPSAQGIPGLGGRGYGAGGGGGAGGGVTGGGGGSGGSGLGSQLLVASGGFAVGAAGGAGSAGGTGVIIVTTWRGIP